MPSKFRTMVVDAETMGAGVFWRSKFEKDETYYKAKGRQLLAMKNGFNLELEGKITWKREDLHA